MTWHTPYGDRCLAGLEAELIRQSLLTMMQELASCRETEEQPWEYGVTLFDELSWQQQLALLDLLAHNLFVDTDQTLELTGINEAGVAAVYQNVAQQIELEIELHSVTPECYRSRWRNDTLLAFEDCRDDYAVERIDDSEFSDAESLDHLESESLDIERWRDVVDLLADRVLWDRDFEMVNEVIDAPPEHAAALRAAMGIEPSYYTAIAPDPTDQQVDEHFDSLEQLTRAKPR